MLMWLTWTLSTILDLLSSCVNFSAFDRACYLVMHHVRLCFRLMTSDGVDPVSHRRQHHHPPHAYAAGFIPDNTTVFTSKGDMLALGELALPADAQLTINKSQVICG